MVAEAQPVQPHEPDIAGFIDAVANDRVYGWAWDRKCPADRLEVQVWIGERRIATSQADRLRNDLKVNGVGDGRHAFEVAIGPLAEGETPDALRVLAASPSSEQAVALGRRPAPGAPAEPDMTAAVGRIITLVEGLTQTNRQLHGAQQNALRTLEKLIREGAATTDPIEAALAEIRESQQALTRQIDSMDVFLMRFDTVLGTLATRLDTLRAGGPDRPLRRVVAVLGIGLALALGWAVLSGLGLTEGLLPM